MTLIDIESSFVFDREQTIAALIDRDGYKCQYPGCRLPFDPDPESRYGRSLDHIYPQVKAKADGWTFEQIWSLDNLQLMHRICNSRKSDLTYDENGNLPLLGRQKTARVPRPEWCALCENGRALYPGEECPECFSGPQPTNWPATLQRSPKDCDHSTYHCWFCTVDTPEIRIPAIQRIAFG
jgi:hypothetical protein